MAALKRSLTTMAAVGVLLGGGPAVAAGAEVSAAAPNTSPAAASRQFISGGGSVTCQSQYACASVPYGNGAYVFKFFRYGRYSLSDWLGRGIAANSQTGGAAMRLENRNQVQIGCIPAGVSGIGVDWDPVWFINLTASPC
ncbi:hypothetical protein ACIBEJ_50770 [Nonomuraea sp. NPDC050790]|uniref:hypothetical protein n=1 Tax=Nonomuraea sp. NPDC050790 TaxID=3364371 RepID=UPI0037BA3C0F